MLDEKSIFVGARWWICGDVTARPKPRAAVLLFKLALYGSCGSVTAGPKLSAAVLLFKPATPPRRATLTKRRSWVPGSPARPPDVVLDAERPSTRARANGHASAGRWIKSESVKSWEKICPTWPIGTRENNDTTTSSKRKTKKRQQMQAHESWKSFIRRDADLKN